jgi:hypothetical protein
MAAAGLVLVALAWEVDRPPAYETATFATANGHLELRELAGGTVPTIEAVTRAWPVVIFAGDTVVGGRQSRTALRRRSPGATERLLIAY